MSEAEPRTANALPTKEFFVRILTRDISIEDCILDLVDNSIDAAWESVGGETPGIESSARLSKFTITVDVRSDEITITDNCGGMSLVEAERYAFSFGRHASEAVGAFSVGVYGIGMKRAVFKLGRDISVRSTHGSGRSQDAFEVPINVQAWLEDDDPAWAFDIVDAEALPEPGVCVKVGSLNPEVAATFADPAFVPRLQGVLERDYMIAVGHGLNLVVNGARVRRTDTRLLSGSGFQPMREHYEDNGVQVIIIAGMQTPPPDENSPDSSERRRVESGWNVLCNGRAVLASDRTELSGWGAPPTPSWHPQYSGFTGYVFFSSVAAESLPMTTTKRSVDPSRAVYKRALARMALPVRNWIDYTNERKSRLEVAKGLEGAAVQVRLEDIVPRAIPELPTLGGEPEEPVANINYARPRREVRALAVALGARSMTYRDVGIRSFEYAYEALVDEDEEK